MAVDIDGVNSTISTDKLIPQSGTALQIGDASDVITIPASATITNLGTATGFGGGITLQTKQKQITTAGSFSVIIATWTDVTGASLAITPSSTDSKILITGTINLGHGGYGGIRLVRDSTVIGVPTDAIGSRAGCHIGAQNHDGASSYEIFPHPLHWIDSPATLSSITYKIQCHFHTGLTVYINQEKLDGNSANRTRSVSTITLTELSAATLS
jgi:hypothetical protein